MFLEKFYVDFKIINHIPIPIPIPIYSEEDDTKSYDLSTVSEEEQYINNIPTKSSNKNLGIVDGQYANKLRHVTYENKKEYVHRKKKLPITYTSQPVL